MKNAKDYYRTKNHENNHRVTTDEGTADFMGSSGGFAQGLTNLLSVDFNGDYDPTGYVSPSNPNWIKDVGRLRDNTNRAAQVPLENRRPDWYILLKNGQIILFGKTNDNYDYLFSESILYNGDKRIRVDKGVLGGRYTQTATDSKGNHFPYDVFKVIGDEKAESLFEFMADNTNVEWSRILLGEAGAKGLNYLTTSHGEDFERGGPHMINTQFRGGYTIRGHIHNHPGNREYPSGLIDREADIGFSRRVTEWYNKQYSRRTTPFFRIYTSGNGEYIDYNKDSELKHFNTTTPDPKPIPLNEIIIYVKKE